MEVIHKDDSGAKILFSPAHYIFDEYQGGSEPYVAFSIADKIAQKFAPNSLVITGRGLLKTKKQYRIQELGGSKVLNMSFFSAIIFTFKYSFATWRALNKEKFDIIHHLRPFSFGSTFNPILLLRANKSIPFIVGPFCSAYKKPDAANNFQRQPILNLVSKSIQGIIKPILHNLSVGTLNRATKVLVYDDYTKQQIVKCIKDEKKVQVIPPGKDQKDFPYLQRNWDQKINFVSVGYLIKRKRFDFLIRCFKRIVDKNPNVQLTIVGDGVERENLQHLIQDLKLEQSVFLVGGIANKDIQKFYHEAHIFVSTQEEESFGQVFIEAMATGLPIVASQTVGANTILKGTTFGFIFEQLHEEQFIGIMSSLLADREKLAILSEEANKHFQENYDWDTVIIPKYLHIYDSILNR